jgi:hypothetical protein
VDPAADEAVNEPGQGTLPGGSQEMGQRAAGVAEQLRTKLLEVAGEIGGPVFRPSRFVELLGIDKSLASRIIRSLRSETSYETLHLIPSPTGLAIFLDSAERFGCTPGPLAAARRAVSEFQDLLVEMPGGRSSLDALMSESAVEVRERAERTASQGVYRSMSYLLGFRCDVVTSAIILTPSDDGVTADGLDVSRREGIRRLRPSAPVALFSVNLSSDVPREAPRLEMLDRLADPKDPRSVLLTEFCEPRNPALELHTEGSHTIFALSNEDVSLQHGVTISSAFHVRNGYLRYRAADLDEESRTYLLHYPCRLLIRDIFIRDDLYPGVEPQIRLQFPAPPGAPSPRANSPGARLNQLDLASPVVSLGRGLHRAAAAGAGQHVRMLGHAFRAAGLDPERYRGYRARIMYPVPMITMGWWITLPPRP